MEDDRHADSYPFLQFFIIAGLIFSYWEYGFKTTSD